MTDQDQLQAVIAQLYDTFSPYKVQHPIAGSPISVTAEMQATLARFSLREVSGEVLSKYLFKAISTWGTVNDFKHYLPRILELLAWDAQSLFWDDLVWSKLTYAGYRSWNPEETALIDQYMNLLWLYLLEEYPSRTLSVTDFLYSNDDVSRFHTVWQAQLNHRSSLLHLADYINHNLDVVSGGLGVLKHLSPQVKWIIQPEILQRLDEAYLANMDGEYAEELSQASQNIKWALDFGES